MKPLLYTLLLCLSSLALRAYVRDPGPAWSDGTVRMQLHLGNSSTYSDGSTPDESALEAIKLWNPYIKRVQLSGTIVEPGSAIKNNGANDVSFRSDIYGEAFSSGTLAVTVTLYTTSARMESDILVNTNYTWDSFRGSLGGRYDIRRVLGHELGHVLGLTHPDTNGQQVTALMNSRISSYVEAPAQDDQDGVASIYGSGGANPPVLPILDTTLPSDRTANAGEKVTLSVKVLTGTTPLSYQWYVDDSRIPNATGPTLEIPTASSAYQGRYKATVTNEAGTVASREASLTVIGTDPAGPPNILQGLATRAFVGTGNDVLIPAFVISGKTQKNILIRALGPSLSSSLTGYLSDPRIELHKAGAEGVVAANDNWSEAPNIEELTQTMLRFYGSTLPTGSKDSAMLISLEPGAYTIVTSGVGDTSGIALVEVYDADLDSTQARLSALAVRCRTADGDKVPIVGFVTSGDRPKQVLVQGIGPTLGLQVPEHAPNPHIRLIGGSTVIGENFDWGNSQKIRDAAAKATASVLNASSKDAALIATISPGAYSAVIDDETGTSGIALIEVYEVPAR